MSFSSDLSGEEPQAVQHQDLSICIANRAETKDTILYPPLHRLGLMTTSRWLQFSV